MEPYLTFSLDLINRAVFTVKVGAGPIGGKIMWSEDDLRNPPKANGPVRIKRGENGNFEFQQDVLPETAEAMRAEHAAQKEVGIRFINVQIPLKAYNPDETFAREANLDSLTRYIVVADIKQ